MYTDNYDEKEEEVKEESYKEPSSGSGNLLKIIVIAILVIALIALLYFVFKGKGNKEPDKYVLTIYPDSIVVPLGKSQNISYEIRKNGIVIPDASVRLTVVDETIASVDNTILTGLKYGKTMIMATYVNPEGKSFQETKDVTVADGTPGVSITNVTFPEGDLQMPFNGTYKINLGITPPNGYVENKVITSSNPSVVTVDETGLVTALSEGQAVITIDVNNGQFKKDIMVYVNRNSEISKLVVSPTDISITNPVTKLKVGETAVLKYSITPSNASIDNIKWESSNEKVLTVDYRGKVTAVKEGSATIKVVALNNVSDSVSILVEKKVTEVTDIVLTTDQLYMTVGEGQMLIPTLNPPEVENVTISYTVDNPSIVQLVPSSDTSNVVITPLTTGTAVLTVKAGNITKTVNITVSTAEPEPQGGGGGGGSCASCSKVTCGAGQYCSCGKCVTCPAGNYCYNNKKTACAAGKGSIPGSSSYQDCSACAKGYYATGNGKGCIACPVGKTTKASGSTSKNDCNVDETNTCKSNEYFDGTKCTGCPKGYTNSGGATSISSCKIVVPAGQYLKTGGASKTTACAAGTYSTVTSVTYGNTSSCKPCAKGYYQDKTGQGSCTKCPSGTTTSGTGSKNSSACSIAAIVTPVPTPTTSSSCYAYQYKSGGVCYNCTAGYKCNGTTRTKCPAGTISVARSTTCTSCSTGKSNDARTQCIR